MPGQPLQWRLYAWVGMAVLSAYCLFWGGAWLATYYVEYRIWALIPAFAVVAVWIAVAATNPAWRPSTALAPAFALALGALAVSTLASREPRFGAEYLALAVLLTALYLILQRLMASSFFRPRMMGFAVLAVLLIGVAYVVATVRWWVIWWDTIGRLAAPPLRPHFESLSFGNPSAVMTVMVLLAAPVLAQLLTQVSAGRLLAAGAVLVLTAFATVASGSRAGWLALAIAIAIVGVLWLLAPDRRAALARLVRSRTGRLAAIPIVALGLVAAAVALPGFLLRAGAGGESLRTAYWAAAVRMFETSPLLGTGPGTWVPQRVTFTLPSETDYYIPHAHNLYVQTLAELGFVGIAVGAVVALLLVRLLANGIRDADPTRRRMAWAATFAAVYFAAHQVLDFYANAPAVLFAYAIPIAWLDATAPEGTRLLPWSRKILPGRRRGAPGGRVAALAGIGALVASAGFLAWSERGALLMREGASWLDGRDAEAAIPPLHQAVRLDPAMTPYHLAYGIALANAGDMASAREHLATAAARDGLPEAWLDLAAVEARMGDPASAARSLDEAMRLGNQQPGVVLGAATVWLELGNQTAAGDAFVRALSAIPTLAGDPWWTATPERAALWPAVFERAFESAPVGARFILALVAGDQPALAAAIGAMPPDEAATSALVAAAWNGDETALRALEVRARQRPLDASLPNWCAVLSRRAGDEDAAAAYLNWADTIYGDASFGGWEVRVASDEGPARVTGISTVYYGHYTYRRPMTIHQLVDWLPELELR